MAEMAEVKTPEEIIEKSIIAGEQQQQRFVDLINLARKKNSATHVVIWRLQDEGFLRNENNCIVYAGESPEEEAGKHDNSTTQVIIVPL